MIKRIAVIQDLSCIGRCSLSVAMAVLPAMGMETAVLPTAILSSHTAFSDFTFLDFSPELEKIIAHWQKMQLRFDAVYIGYLGSQQLIALTRRFLSIFCTPETQVILDPAFGDHGALYKGFDAEYVRAMAQLCAEADIILPNVTEACFLLDLPYGDDEATTALLKAESRRLLTGRLKHVLITSCRFPGERMGLVCAGEQGFEYIHERLPLACHGSGDLFASVFSGMYAQNRSIADSARTAADFVCDCIRFSMNCPDHRWYGVDFEPMLPELIRRISGRKA